MGISSYEYPPKYEKAVKSTDAVTFTKTWYMRNPLPIWEHRIILGGLDFSDAKIFGEKLHNTLAKILVDRSKAHYEEVLTAVLSDLNSLIPHKKFIIPNASTHELSSTLDYVNKDPLYIKNLIDYSFTNSKQIEFAYRSLRRGSDGSENEELHMRRVIVTSYDPKGFQAKHSRGSRRFNNSSVAWAAMDNGRYVSFRHSEPLAEPLIVLSIENADSVNKLVTTVGYVGDNGALVMKSPIPEEHDFFALEASRFMIASDR